MIFVTFSFRLACAEGEIQCKDGTCVPGKKCDRLFDCLDESDENECGFCRPDQFPCQDGGCIAEHLRCDGSKHCSDGSDELNCGMSAMLRFDTI